MKIFVLNTLFALAVLLIGCRPSSVGIDLNRADHIMESHPDSALAILHAIDTAALASKADRALYNLLLTQSEVKCHRPITNATGISSSIEYFTAHGPKRDLMRAFFYDGVAMYYYGDHQKSVLDALSAHDIAINLDDLYWQAKTNELIADNFSKTYNCHGAIPYVKKAAELYERSGRHLNHLFSMCDYAINLGAAHDRRRSAEIVDSIYNIACNELGDSALMAYCLHAQIPNVKALGNYQRIDQIIEELKKFDSLSPITSLDYYALCVSSIAQHDLLRAEYASNMVKERYSGIGDSALILKSHADIAEALDDYKTAYANIERLLALDDYDTRKLFERSIVAAQRDYFTNKANKEIYNNHRIKIGVVISIVFLIVVSILVFIIIKIRFRYKDSEIERKVSEIWNLSLQVSLRNKENTNLLKLLEEKRNEIKDINKKMAAEIERKRVEISDLSSQISQRSAEKEALSKRLERNEADMESLSDQMNEEIRRKMDEMQGLTQLVEVQKKKNKEDSERIIVMNDMVKGLFKDRLEILNALCGEFYDSRESRVAKARLYESIEKELDKMKSDDEIKKIENGVNKINADIIVKMRKQCLFLNDADIKFITLNLAGFSYRAICLLLDISSANFYQKRSRLIARIQKSDAADRDFFVRSLKG